MDEGITLSGIVLADGSLHLSVPVPLPQCEVQVTIRAITSRKAAHAQHNGLSRPRARHVSKPVLNRPKEIDAELQRIRDEYEYGGSD